MPNRENISASIFLELLLAVSGETEEDIIIEKTLRLYLRKLDCFAVAVFQREADSNNQKAFLPGRFKEMADTEAVLKNYTESGLQNNDFYCEAVNNAFHYFFRLDDYGILYLARRSEFSAVIVKEFLPVIDNLGKALSFAQNIRLREIAEAQTKKVLSDLNLLSNFMLFKYLYPAADFFI